MLKKTITTLLTWIVILTSAQVHDYGFIKSNTIPVFHNDSALLHPWAGGINNIQFAKIDIDFDGIKDLVAFEVHGRRILPFLNKSKSANEINYVYSPEYAHLFPDDIHGFFQLIDFNNDGKEDIFTYGIAGIKVYKNVSDTELKFVEFTDQVTSIYYENYINLFCTEGDYIVIKDMDGDGDLDILAFWALGKYVDFHKNMSVEKYGNTEHLDFKLVERCWGYFSESEEGNTITLNDYCDNIKQPYSKQHRHTGSTMLMLDENGSGLYDMLLGDMDYPNLFLLRNGGISDSAHIVGTDSLFPSYDIPVNLYSMPCPMYIDVNNDGIKDLIVSPLDLNLKKSENINSVWWYKNVGTNEKPIFNLQTKSFLQDQMIDVGSGAFPVLCDIDGNGLPDLFIGNYGYYDSSEFKHGILKCFYSSSIAYYKNIGSKNNPIFELVTDDFCNLRQHNYLSLSPTFADINNDGKIDMMVGTSDGNILFFENNSKGETVSFKAPVINYQQINIGEYATPQLFDINNDGLFDLIIGNRKGNLMYYKNTGTAEQAVFTLETNNLGNVDVRDYDESYFGYACPHFFRNENREIRLFVGAENGYIYYYKNIDNNLNGSFTLQDSMFFVQNNNRYPIQEGIRTAPFCYPLTNDTFPDLFIGNYAGGIAHYKGITPPSIHIGISEQKHSIHTNDIRLYPNPSQTTFTLESAEKIIEKIEIIDILGKSMCTKNIHNVVSTHDISHLKNGVYIIKIQLNNKQITIKKLIKND